MDALRTEMMSINRLKSCLIRNDRLVSYISENDKTPSWDGEIIVYNNNSISKKDIKGKVPVQVKGSFQQNLSKNMIKYSIRCSDLKNYLISNGVIFFVVYMKDYDNFKIYYNALLPFDIKRLIKEAGKNKSKTVEFHEFPKDDQNEVTNVFLNFVNNMKLQSGTLDPRIYSILDIKELGLEVDKFHFGYTGVGFNNYIDVINYSLTHSTYIYAQPKGFDVKIPIEKIDAANQILADVPAPVKVEDEVFYTNYQVLHEVGKQEIKIGKSFTFNIQLGNFDYNISGTLLERIKDTEFLIALLENKKIDINGVILPLRTSSNSSESIESQKEYLNILKEINSTLEILCIKKDFEMENLSDGDYNKLHELVRAILWKENVSLNINGGTGIGDLSIGNLNIRLTCNNENNDGKFKVNNYFEDDDLICTTIIDGKELILSQYANLKSKDFITISNINYPRIINSIIHAPKTAVQDDFTNILVLEMIKAYDEQKEKDMEILNYALEIVNLLLKNSAIDSSILKLNKFQIIKRQRALSLYELNEITEIKSISTDNSIMLGASILLESNLEAEYYYLKLQEEAQQQFHKYPISNLWKNNK